MHTKAAVVRSFGDNNLKYVLSSSGRVRAVASASQVVMGDDIKYWYK